MLNKIRREQTTRLNQVFLSNNLDIPPPINYIHKKGLLNKKNNKDQKPLHKNTTHFSLIYCSYIITQLQTKIKKKKNDYK